MENEDPYKGGSREREKERKEREICERRKTKPYI